MPYEPDVNQLLLSWEAARESGREVSPEELCCDCPDVLDELRSRISTSQFGPDLHTLGNRDTPISGEAETLQAETLPEVPGYEILKVLGRGGMGVVYKARQMSLNRLVALKMIRSASYAGAEELGRFRTEAEAVARLQHPNIIQIHEVGSCDGSPYVALEYVSGGSLDRRLAGTPLPAERAARMIETLALAVHHAHEHGVVHRDLKPANILVAADVELAAAETVRNSSAEKTVATLDAILKITDFGLAKLVQQDSGHTRSGSILGTPSYMAPEQARGEIRAIGPAADVYALGAILYEFLTGRPPFKAETAWDTVAQVIGTEPLAPRHLNPNVPRDLETICLKCLAKNPNGRYESAQSLAEDLQRYRNGETIRARPASVWVRADKWARRRPALAALLMTGFIAVVSLLGLWAKYSMDLKVANQLTSNERDSALAAERKATAEWEKSRRSLFALQLGFVGAIHETDPDRGLKMLLDENHCPTELREFTWGLFYRLCRRDRLTLAAHDGQARALAVSRCGRYLASGGGDGKAKLWDAATGSLLATMDAATDLVFSVDFDADAKTLATGGKDGRVRLWQVPSGKELATLHTGEMIVASVAFAPRSSAPAFGAWDGTVRVFPTPESKPIILPGASKSTANLAFSPDGKELAATAEGRVRTWKTSTWKENRDRKGPTGLVTALAYSPDGKMLACCDQNGMLTIWNTGTGEESKTIKVGSTFVFALAFTPDSTEIAAGALDGIVRVWDAATGLERVRFTKSQATVWGLAFTPDGKTLVSADQSGTVTVREMELGFERRTLARLPGDTHSLALSADGTRMAIPGSKGMVRLLDVATGKEINQWTGHQGAVTALALSRDDKTLASAGSDGTVRLWDLSGGREPIVLKGHRDVVWSVAFASDGRTLASAGQDGAVRLWDVTAGSEKAVLTANDKIVWSVAFTPDGRTLGAGGSDGVVRLWDVATSTVRTALPRRDRSVYAVAFAPDGATLAAGGADGLVELWDLPTGEKRLTLRGHVNWVMSLAFSSNGLTLASGSRDGSLRLWDPVYGHERLRLTGHPEKVNAVAFAAVRQVLAVVGPNQVRVWMPRFPDSP